MLIGFSGSCNSGKTTLARYLSKALKEMGYKVYVVEEVVRDVFERFKRMYGFRDLNEIRKSDKHFKFQLEVLKEQIRREDEALNHSDYVISDRTIYDNLFYTIFWNSADWSTLREYVSTFKSLGERRYDVIFLCRPLSLGIRDGFRDFDLNYVELQDLVIELLVDRERVVEVPEADVEERIRLCLKSLGLEPFP